MKKAGDVFGTWAMIIAKFESYENLQVACEVDYQGNIEAYPIRSMNARACNAGESGARNKYEVALAIARRFPELALRLPPIRKPWMPEDYEMPVFDAAALAVTYFYFDNKKKRAA